MMLFKLSEIMCEKTYSLPIFLLQAVNINHMCFYFQLIHIFLFTLPLFFIDFNSVSLLLLLFPMLILLCLLMVKDSSLNKNVKTFTLLFVKF